MAQFCVNIPDEQIQLVITSLCSLYKYVPLVQNPDPTNHPNPAFDPQLPEGPDNLKSIPQFLPNPNYLPPEEGDELTMEEIMGLEPEFVLNPDWNPPTMIPNPESPYQFVNRIVRGWISENVKAYQAQIAAEAARQAALEATQVEITDPYVG
jgi:hypothetical protein